MKRNVGRMLVRGLLQSFFIVFLLLGAGILGFRLTLHAWKAKEPEAMHAYQEDTLPDSIIEPSIDDISRNLIYCYEDKTKEIKKVILEIFHCRDHRITYITIPMRLQLNLSDALYRRLTGINPEIPKVMQLSALSGYLDSDTIFDYGVLILEEQLGIQMSYYTAVPENIYETVFTGEYRTEASAGTDISDPAISAGQQEALDNALPAEVFRDEFMEFIRTLTYEADIKAYIEELYPSLRSNLSVSHKMNYLESYAETPIENITFVLLRGENQNSAFLIDRMAVAKQLAQLMRTEDDLK